MDTKSHEKITAAAMGAKSTAYTGVCFQHGLGKYFVKGGFLWHQPYKITTDTVTGSTPNYVHTFTISRGEYE